MVRIEGAVLMPLSPRVRFSELPRDRPLLLQCAVGGRSRRRPPICWQAAYSDVTNVAGGIVGWERAGLPVRRGRVEPGEGELPG